MDSLSQLYDFIPAGKDFIHWTNWQSESDGCSWRMVAPAAISPKKITEAIVSW